MTTSVLKLSSGAVPATPGSGIISVYSNANNILSQVDQNGNAIPFIGPGAFSLGTPADPTGTTDATGKMMGLAQTATPTRSGALICVFNGTITNNTGTTGNGAKAQIRYGSGSAPANAAALTGTVLGTFTVMKITGTTGSLPMPFSLTAGVTGLTLGTAYWFDLQLASIAAGTANLNSLTCTIWEL